ncbi:hypothetical protein ACLKA7_012355 [Drosophila subpalustris]
MQNPFIRPVATLTCKHGPRTQHKIEYEYKYNNDELRYYRTYLQLALTANNKANNSRQQSASMAKSQVENRAHGTQDAKTHVMTKVTTRGHQLDCRKANPDPDAEIYTESPTYSHSRSHFMPHVRMLQLQPLAGLDSQLFPVTFAACQ